MKFSVELVKRICGGKFPNGDGFAWDIVEHFRLEGVVLQPYSGKNILPGPGIHLEATLKDENDIFLVQGFFYQDSHSLTIVGGAPAFYPVKKFDMFMGMFGKNPENPDEMHGRMNDKYGDSIITDIRLDKNRFSFLKKYKSREDTIRFRFQKSGSIWVGTFQGKAVRRGIAQCVVSRVPADFANLPI